MQVKQRILIADASEKDARFTEYYLTQALYEVRIVTDAAFLRVEYVNFQPALVLMEAVFPGMEKFQACKELLRYAQSPIIFLSSEAETEDRVRGLEMGADDYLAKPADARELLARIRAVLRRCTKVPQKETSPKPQGEYVEYPDLIINLTNYSVVYQGRDMTLPPRELELLYTLAASPNQVFSREQLLELLWGYDYMGDTRTVDVHIKRLREKFRGNPNWAIKTVWGVGYKFETNS